MEELDKLKESTIIKYEMALALIGDEICEEIDSKLPDDLELMRKKAICYCDFLKNIKHDDDELKEKCKKYLNYLIYHQRIK